MKPQAKPLLYHPSSGKSDRGEKYNQTNQKEDTMSNQKLWREISDEYYKMLQEGLGV